MTGHLGVYALKLVGKVRETEPEIVLVLSLKMVERCAQELT